MMENILTGSVGLSHILVFRLKVFEDHAARRLINKMDVNCCNEGCSWIGSLSSLLEVISRLCVYYTSSNNALVVNVRYA